MKVILIEDVPKLGQAGQIEEVADGYARNYLLPQGMAKRATPGVLKDFKHRQEVQARKRDRMAKRAQRVAERMKGLTLSFDAKAGRSGRLYGSITKADIAEALKEETGEGIGTHDITLPESIRELGKHVAFVRLMEDMEPQIEILVRPDSGEWPEGTKPEDLPEGA